MPIYRNCIIHGGDRDKVDPDDEHWTLKPLVGDVVVIAAADSSPEDKAKAHVVMDDSSTSYVIRAAFRGGASVQLCDGTSNL